MRKVYVNGDILTLDRKYANAEVVITDGDTITAVGDSSLLSQADGGEIIDLKGNTMIPGFVVKCPNKEINPIKLGITTLITDNFEESEEIVLDGELSNKQAYLSMPYYVVPNGELLSYSGIANFKYMEIKKFIGSCGKSGHNIKAVANGSGAIEQFLNAYEKFYRNGKLSDMRCRLIGCEDIQESQLDRIRMFNISLEISPWRIFQFGDLYRESVFGENFADKINPFNSLFVKGVQFCVDIGRYSVLENIQFSVLRRTSKNKLLGKSERLTPLRALNSVTMNGAEFLGMEKEIGSITPGKKANLVILNHNPCNLKKSEFSLLVILKTIKNGDIS